MYSRCEALAKKYNDEHMSWEYIKAQDTLMRYSDEFRQCVAELCGVDPNTGEPIWPAEPAEPAEPEDVPESEQVQEAPAADSDEPGPSDEELAEIEAEKPEEAEEAEEAAQDPEPPKKRRGRPKKEPEPELEQEPEPETEPEEEAEEVADVRPWNLCHWCQQDAAVTAVYVYVQDDGDPSQRMVRCEHLCRSCADSFWSAVREAQYAAMTPADEEEEEDDG